MPTWCCLRRIWGEKTGTFTNVDRTVHISDKAVDPPGEARSDLDIFLDYARRMGFRDKDGEPLIKWTTPEEAFEAWKACSRGRPCDYSGMTYEKLRGRQRHPVALQRGASRGHRAALHRRRVQHRRRLLRDLRPRPGHRAPRDTETSTAPTIRSGRAILNAAEYQPPDEEPSAEYPFLLTTGRTVYHFHTRTKTGRAPQLKPGGARTCGWSCAATDAATLGIQEGDLVRLESPRGRIDVRRASPVSAQGVVFTPFHYGYLDDRNGSSPNGSAHAANELTLTEWDPVSKQPYFKAAAVRVVKLADAGGAAVPRTNDWWRGTPGGNDLRSAYQRRADGGGPFDDRGELKSCTSRTIWDWFIALSWYWLIRFARLPLPMSMNQTWAPSAKKLAGQCDQHAAKLAPFVDHYGEEAPREPERLHNDLFGGTRSGGLGLLRDLHDLYLMASEVDISWTLVGQAAQGAL